MRKHRTLRDHVYPLHNLINNLLPLGYQKFVPFQTGNLVGPAGYSNLEALKNHFSPLQRQETAQIDYANHDYLTRNNDLGIEVEFEAAAKEFFYVNVRISKSATT